MKTKALASIGFCLFTATGLVALPSSAWTEIPLVLAQSVPRSWHQTDISRLSVRYPAHWFVSSASEDTLILYNQKPTGKIYSSPPYFVKTDVSFTPVSFSEAILPSGREMPSRLIKQEALTVDGRQALRKWHELDDTFTNSITTYIRYNDQETAYAVSFYNQGNRAAEAVIIQVHNSLTLRL